MGGSARCIIRSPTSSPLAQKYFDQGLAFTYGFNHDEAERSFEQAAQIDPNMAMADWGIALVLGPNYNLPGDPARSKKAYDAVARARALKPGASPEERDLIDALAQRYGANGAGSTAEDQAYANAMRTVAHKYPDDLDVQTLFAESLMDLHPWRLWSIDGKPGPDTIETVTTLETVLKKDPNHIGANHYYIHAVEASPDPSRAMASADRLGNAGARRRPSGAHALAHLRPHRPLPRRGRGQRERNQGGQCLLRQDQGGRRLSADILHPQHPFPLLLGDDRGTQARRARERPFARDQGAAGGGARDADGRVPGPDAVFRRSPLQHVG